MTAEPILRASGLRVRRDGVDVLSEVDLDVRPGDVVAVLGPNGAGKSTLLETLAGVIEPSAGRVERAGRVIAALQSPDLARRSVTANVRAALAWAGVPRAQRAPRAARALAAMRAEHLADRDAGALSGGERRRVHLARAVAIEPDVLLLDEPFAGLDAATRADLLHDAAAAFRAGVAATVVVVHDRAEAWALADRLVVLLDGDDRRAGRPRASCSSGRRPVEVARFLGFDGALSGGDGVLLTRPANVTIDPAGDIPATVGRLIPLEDGVRVQLETERGTVFALADVPGPAVGDRVALRVTGGMRYPQRRREPS